MKDHFLWGPPDFSPLSSCLNPIMVEMMFGLHAQFTTDVHRGQTTRAKMYNSASKYDLCSEVLANEFFFFFEGFRTFKVKGE